MAFRHSPRKLLGFSVSLTSTSQHLEVKGLSNTMESLQSSGFLSASLIIIAVAGGCPLSQFKCTYNGFVCWFFLMATGKIGKRHLSNLILTLHIYSETA